jgi:hypothetical protein
LIRRSFERSPYLSDFDLADLNHWLRICFGGSRQGNLTEEALTFT